MSRIHQALKKAEQERAANPMIDVPLADSPTPAVAASVPPAQVSDLDSILTSALPTAPLQDQGLRFDDLQARGTSARWELDPQMNVFFDPSGTAPGAEQFRTLRSRLYQLRSEQPLKTILITSAVPAEGKTFVTSNLVQAIVRQPDRRALVIDADMRRSRLHNVWGTPGSPGLSDYLNGSADGITIIQHNPAAGNLCLIPSGSSVNNPSELLLNGRMKVLIHRLAPVFDWIVIDSPPCLPVADASVLADVCDGVLLVVRAASTPLETAQRACQELQTKKLIGVVLNRADEGSHYGSYNYYDPKPQQKSR
jgi:protein-tyrosine kinase